MAQLAPLAIGDSEAVPLPGGPTPGVDRSSLGRNNRRNHDMSSGDTGEAPKSHIGATSQFLRITMGE